jgi:hypothetical protein
VKRALLYRFDRRPVEAVVDPGCYLQGAHIELITIGGNLQAVPYADVKALCFASDPGREDLFRLYSLFERRPKVPGLWTRFTLRDGDRIDGMLSHNLIEWPATGYLITPPRADASRQLVFIPRAAITSTELLGVVGISALSEAAVRRRREESKKAGQLTIFDQ